MVGASKCHLLFSEIARLEKETTNEIHTRKSQSIIVL